MPASEPAPGGPKLVRAIGRWDLTAAVVNGVIGSSIFGMPDDIARLCGTRSPVAYLLAGLGILAIVLCFAEVASRSVRWSDSRPDG
jgi:amino acid transporter